MTGAPVQLAAVTRKPDGDDFDQRVLRYRTGLAERGIHVEPLALPKGPLAKRRLIRRLGEYDGVWWHRHRLTWPHLDSLRAASRCIAYDIDDPVIFSSRSGRERSRTRQRRFAAMLKQCDAVFAGNQYLVDLCRAHAPRVEWIPMAIDAPETVSVERAGKDVVELLWLGSAVTQEYLEEIRPALEQLGERCGDVVLRLVAHRPMEFGSLRVDYRRWSPQEQEQALRQCDIGLCPMPDTIWTRGKCPFKVIQYMAYGMPWIGSPVGENLPAAGDPQNDPRGLCAGDSSQWLAALRSLIDQPQRRQAMGYRCRDYVAEHHDRTRLTDRLASLWRGLLSGIGRVKNASAN